MARHRRTTRSDRKTLSEYEVDSRAPQAGPQLAADERATPNAPCRLPARENVAAPNPRGDELQQIPASEFGAGADGEPSFRQSIAVQSQRIVVAELDSRRILWYQIERLKIQLNAVRNIEPELRVEL